MKLWRSVTRVNRRYVAFLHDMVSSGVAFALAVSAAMPIERVTASLPTLTTLMVCGIVGGAVLFRAMGLYKGVWRFASLPDMVRIAHASVVLSGLYLAVSVLSGGTIIPASVALVLCPIQLILLGGPRFVLRGLADRHRLRLAQSQRSRAAVIVFGTDPVAVNFIRAVRSEPQSPYVVLGIVESGPGMAGRQVLGLPILGSLGDLKQIIVGLRAAGHQPQRLAVPGSIGAQSDPTLAEVLNACESAGLTVGLMPQGASLHDPAKQVAELRPVAVEDLLGRPQATLDRSKLSHLVQGRVVLVTGAGGTIGGELTRQIAELGPKKLVMIDNGEFNLYSIDQQIHAMLPVFPVEAELCDIRDRTAISRIFNEHRPEVVIHAGALKHVPLVEANPTEGVLTNIVGTRNVVDACVSVGSRLMVMISTDKAIRPPNVMGATKRVAELYCQAMDLQQGGRGGTRFVTVRFGNVLGSSGSVVPLFQRQLAAGGPLTVTHPDMRRYFMTVREAVELVLQAAVYGLDHSEDRGRIFVLDMGEPVRIVDLATQMIRLAGLRPGVDVQIQFTGLRPGEKLFEEIFDAEEDSTATSVKGVFIASPRVIDPHLLMRALDEVEQAARSGGIDRIRVILSNLVPGFQPGASAVQPLELAGQPPLRQLPR